MTVPRSFCFVVNDCRFYGVEFKFRQLTFIAHTVECDRVSFIESIEMIVEKKKHRLCLPVNVCAATLRFTLLFAKHLCWFNS